MFTISLQCLGNTTVKRNKKKNNKNKGKQECKKVKNQSHKLQEIM